MKYRVKRFSKGQILNTRLGLGFNKHRKYDTDMDRLGRMETAQSELRKTGTLNDELRKAKQELRGYGI